MMSRSRPRSATYAASLRKTFHSMLRHLLHTQFPATFGSGVARLFADMIQELHERCHPPLSRVKVGQVLWLAVAADERPSRSKRMEDTRLVPVLLDLVTDKDIEDTGTPGKRLAVRAAKVVRLFRQAYDQGAVLSEADVALLLHVDPRTISRDVLAHEQTSEQSVPRRGTIHDLGPSVTHKAVICYKRLVEKKSTSEVAEETFHSPEEVEYYVQCCRRVQLCHDNGMSPEDIAHVTGHTLFLVRQYLDLLHQFALPSLANTPRKDGVQPVPK